MLKRIEFKELPNIHVINLSNWRHISEFNKLNFIDMYRVSNRSRLYVGNNGHIDIRWTQSQFVSHNLININDKIGEQSVLFVRWVLRRTDFGVVKEFKKYVINKLGHTLGENMLRNIE